MVGQTLAHYKILGKIGSGGMGDVYVAEDTKLDRKVALKVLPPEVAESEQRRSRFKREAKAVAALSHPNIVHLYSVEEADGVHFITMELVPGKTLSEVLPEKGFSLTKLLAIAIQLADAVSSAHDQGIIHRDLKPDNVMVSEDGRVKVLDFGLAKLRPEPGESDSALPTEAATGEGHIVGTVAYMSPEQAEGKTIDQRSDVFSMGVLLYEMVTGERPFRGESATAILSSILRDTPAPVTDIRPGVPRDLVKIIRRCLEKSVEERLQTAKDLRNQLQELKGDLESGESFEAPAALPPARSTRPLWIAGAVLTVLALAWATGVIPTPGGRRQRSVPLLTNPLQVTSAVGVEDYPTWSPDGQTLAYAAAEAGSPLGGNWDIWVTQAGGSQAVNRTADHPGGDRAPSWSPDGRQIAFWSDRDGGGYFVMSALGGAVRKVISSSVPHDPQPAANRGGRPDWSPDGERLAGVVRGADGVAVEITTVSNQASQRLPLPGRRTWRFDLSWSPDGRFFAYVDAHAYLNQVTQLWLLRVEDGQAFPVTDDRTEVWSPSWAEDSRTVYYVSNRGESRDLWQQRLGSDGQPEGEPEPVTVGIGMSRAVFSPDRTRLAYSRGRLVANLWRVPLLEDRPAEWRDAEQLTFDQALVEYLDVSPDGTRVLISSDRSGNCDLWMLPAEGGELTQITADPTPDWWPRWSPDGTEIAFYAYRSGNREVWVMPVTGGPARQLTAGETVGAEAHFPEWSHDGRRIAFSFRTSSSIETWQVPGEGGEARPMPGTRTGDNNDGFSPDGDRMVLTRREGGVPSLWLLSLVSGDREPLTEGSTGRWSRDGRRVYFERTAPDSDSNVWAISLEGRAERPVTHLQGRRGNLMDYAVDERYLYFSWGEHLGDLWVMDVVTDESE